MGVVYHANYLVYFEEARTRFLAELGFSYAELERSGFGLAVRKTELRYRSSARYDDELTLTTTVTGLRFGSIVLEYRLVRDADGALVATGSTKHACLGADGKIVRLPDDLKASLS